MNLEYTSSVRISRLVQSLWILQSVFVFVVNQSGDVMFLTKYHHLFNQCLKKYESDLWAITVIVGELFLCEMSPFRGYGAIECIELKWMRIVIVQSHRIESI